MSLTILYFARVAELMGRSQDQLELPDTVSTLGGLADWIEAQGGALGDRARLRGAVDQVMAGMESSILGAREVAFFPPVTGG